MARTRSSALAAVVSRSRSSMYLPTRTSPTSVKPSAWSDCWTVLPCGSRMPRFGVTKTRAVTSPMATSCVTFLHGALEQDIRVAQVVREVEQALQPIGGDVARDLRIACELGCEIAAGQRVALHGAIRL